MLKSKLTHLTVRILIGVIFIISSIFKLISIDSFEIYIYSFGLLSLNNAFLVSRFIISLELLGGILMVLGVYKKRVIQLLILSLFVFSFFIVYLLLSGGKEHCHCFGEVVIFSHYASLFKNIVLIVLLWFVSRTAKGRYKYEKIILSASVIFSFVLPIMMSPPDSFYFERYAKKDAYQKTLLEDFLKKNENIAHGKKILCFFSTGCRFCKLSAKKMTVISNKVEGKERIFNVFWGTEDTVDKFYTETNSTHFNYMILKPKIFLKLTNGEMPLILLLEDGVVKGEYGYRSIDEEHFINFLTKP